MNPDTDYYSHSLHHDGGDRDMYASSSEWYNDNAATDIPQSELAYSADTLVPTSEALDHYYYTDGQVIEQHWHGVFVFLAYVAAFIGAYSAIRLLEHGLWRSERERANASSFITRNPQFFTSLILGSCTIWSMHFVGMQAVSLDHIDDMCYDWVQTVASLLLSVTGVYAGVILASRDIFNGSNRVHKLKQLLQNDPFVTSKLNRQRASRHIHMVALFHKLHWIATGSLFAALGALSMHYVGMHAMKGPFRRQWSIGMIGASVVVGAVVCFAGFWILFRPLHWKVEKGWYRQAAAGVIALAVCFLHFLGMLSVTYIADSTVEYSCGRREVWGWKSDQLKVLFAGIAVPFVAFVVEHTISNELRITYRQLLDIQLTGSQFLGGSSSGLSSATTGGTRSSFVYVSGLDSTNHTPGSNSSNSNSNNKRNKRAFATLASGHKSLSQKQRDWDLIYNSAEQSMEESVNELEEKQRHQSPESSSMSFGNYQSFAEENLESVAEVDEANHNNPYDVENPMPFDDNGGCNGNQSYPQATTSDTPRLSSTTNKRESSQRRLAFLQAPPMLLDEVPLDDEPSHSHDHGLELFFPPPMAMMEASLASQHTASTCTAAASERERFLDEPPPTEQSRNKALEVPSGGLLRRFGSAPSLTSLVAAYTTTKSAAQASVSSLPLMLDHPTMDASLTSDSSSESSSTTENQEYLDELVHSLQAPGKPLLRSFGSAPSLTSLVATYSSTSRAAASTSSLPLLHTHAMEASLTSQSTSSSEYDDSEQSTLKAPPPSLLRSVGSAPSLTTLVAACSSASASIASLPLDLDLEAGEQRNRVASQTA